MLPSVTFSIPTPSTVTVGSWSRGATHPAVQSRIMRMMAARHMPERCTFPGYKRTRTGV